jgi:hypothetical protein
MLDAGRGRSKLARALPGTNTVDPQAVIAADLASSLTLRPRNSLSTVTIGQSR